MKYGLHFTLAMAVLVGTSSFGFAGQGMGSDGGKKHTPDNIQRSTPSGEKSLPSGSGPGSRADQLTEMEDIKAESSTSHSSGDGNVPDQIQRSTPSAEKSLSSGSGPGAREDQLTEMDKLNAQSAGAKSHASKKKNIPSEVQRSTPSAEKSLSSGSGPGSRTD